MGLFSWICAKSGESIMNDLFDKGFPEGQVTLITPKDRVFAGTYGGYGNIKRAGKDDIDVMVEVGKDLIESDIEDKEEFREFLFKQKNGYELVMTNVKMVRTSEYKGEKFADLKISESCPNQGDSFIGDLKEGLNNHLKEEGRNTAQYIGKEMDKLVAELAEKTGLDDFKIQSQMWDFLSLRMVEVMGIKQCRKYLIETKKIIDQVDEEESNE